MRILLTGGAGFIGHHVLDHFLDKTDWYITILDRLDHSGNLNRIAEVLHGKQSWAKRVRFFFHDLRAPFNVQALHQLGTHDIILHLAALTHVDRSIADPMAAVMDNVVGTTNMLEAARQVGCEQFLYFSTDEVFGASPHGNGGFYEWDRYRSGNPYAATKAGGEEMALAYQNTYGVPVIITHTMNVFGIRQHPEKYIPMLIRKIYDGERITIHANPARTRAGSRFYISAHDVASAIHFLVGGQALAGDKYNIVGAREVDNLELAQMVAAVLQKPLHYELVDFHSSRPGHDLRYALDGSKLENMGWRRTHALETALPATVEWTLENPRWLYPAPH